MNKFRLIPSILYKNNTAIRGKNFESWRTIGSIMQLVRLYSLRQVDELIFLDVDAYQNKKLNLNLIKEFTDQCFMPIIVGGGIRTIDDIESLLKVGADRVSINSSFFFNDKIVKDGIKYFGSQCIIISIDYKMINKKKIVYVKSGKHNTGIELKDYLKKVEQLGVSEIILTSIDHDGVMNGCDNKTINKVNKNFKFKVIGAGGVGKPEHVLETIKETNISAISCSSIFQFTNTTPQDVKQYLLKNKIKIRV